MGSVLNIPREGGSINRFYMELPRGIAAKDVELEHLQAVARRIFYPYQMDFADTVWWLAYAIGQRIPVLLSEKYTIDGLQSCRESASATECSTSGIRELGISLPGSLFKIIVKFEKKR